MRLGLIRKNGLVYMCLLPGFFFIGLFLVYPAWEAFRMSFLDWNMRNYLHPEYVGFANYVQVLGDPVFRKSFAVLLVFVMWALVIFQGASIIGAYLIYLLGNGRIGAIAKAAFTVPMVVPGMVITLFWLFFYEPNYGMLNHILSSIGLESWTMVWLGQNQASAIGSILMKGFPWISGMGFLIYLAGFQAIDESVKEAAVMDGASRWKLFTKVDFPMILPQLRLTTILVLVGGIQQFSDQMIMTKGGPGYDTTVPGLFMYNNAFSYGQLGIGSAIGVILFLIIMLLTFLNMRFMREQS
ncbi:carbohydrate ABC transporter permease [Cohnella sp. REN36]|uniref:carbohydrate ABC transporter permease n=1 Tax=Cohnella sp. REN36 TaxID=2887347 RepID=UPI001D148C8A|nr:sugar ABC transporter permease [Cohnella sp. REN36]MCC3375845.1 sugar ABC transporter permease [Cohnella sp. REN36]